ncbi:YceI family protein [Botryobacter ruber]|uniref:YceI family protein n=1 Tax=Botryobacter ruber TaxID=2171629 RepID=UPI000E0B0279|nr:YceI family protein [Botryobacter ruber]
MKRNLILASLAAVLVFSAFTGSKHTPAPDGTAAVAVAAKAKSYAVVVEKSELKWNAKKITGEHYGTINLREGQILVSGSKPTGGSFVIDMPSLVCTDNGRVGAHLKNDDFFGVDKHPTAAFKITSLKPIAKAAAGTPNYTVVGDLTIKGITQPVTFPALITVKDGVATAKGDVTVDRTKYDIRYRSSSFFENLGDKAIYDEFTVSLNVVAQQAAAL